MSYFETLFDLSGRVAVVTGGTGVLGSAMGAGLAGAGARVAILGRDRERGEAAVKEIEAGGGEAMLLQADVLNTADLEAGRSAVLDRWGQVDILVNAAGGGTANSIVTEEQSYFDLPRNALEEAIDLNLLGTLHPTQILAAPMADRGEGCIVNISSVTAQHPLTKTVGYGAAKAGIEHFTRWLAVEVAQRYGPRVRVNCIAPGFFLAIQNRDILISDDGSLTKRGQDVMDHTPMARFGEPKELVGALVWLCSPSASFTTGAVVTVDGGFTAFSGV